MKLVLLLAILLILTDDATSQSIVRNKFAAHAGLSGGFDVGVAYKNNYVNPSITYFELISIFKNERFFVGWTGRLSTFSGHNLDYYTAPARLTRGKAGLGSLTQPLQIQNIDTVHFERVSQTSLNFGIRAEVNLGRVQLGAGVDLAGLNLLRTNRTGIVHSSTGLFATKDSLGRDIQKPFQGADAYQISRPNRLNVRLLGDNDHGMLTTEIYARVYLSSHVALKIGYQWMTTERVLTTIDLVANNNRFRNRAGLPYVAFTFPLDTW